MHAQWKQNRIVATGLLVALPLLLTAAALAVENNTFERTLTVNGQVTLHVSTGSGSIRISPGAGNQVHIVGHVKANHDWWGEGSSADTVAKVIADPPIEQTGNIIRVGGKEAEGALRHVSIDYEITTPGNTLLTAESGSGDLQLTDMTGIVKGETGSGSIRAERLGSGSRLETGSGSIDANGLLGSAVLQTGSGDIRAQLTSAGDVTAGTGSGSIRLTNIQGAVKAETGSGDLEINGQPTAPWKLETGSGSITLGLGNAHFTLDADTGSGTVKSDLPFAMKVSSDKHHVQGMVNGGGPTVKAETGSGDIHIH